jgi:hypothetical protein
MRYIQHIHTYITVAPHIIAVTDLPIGLICLCLGPHHLGASGQGVYVFDIVVAHCSLYSKQPFCNFPWTPFQNNTIFNQ